jgi:GT2 family glycosyltransferase/glycosyltransferase involved in cell wall biosynthesis
MSPRDRQAEAVCAGNTLRARTGRRRVLILDFDFFSTVGGGQVLYRRIVERNPATDFFYPSAGEDLRRIRSGRLPANAVPFAYDKHLDTTSASTAPHWLQNYYNNILAAVGAAVQGATFHAVDVPSFFPVAHLARPILTAYGVMAERVAVGLVGWQTASLRNSYEKTDPEVMRVLEDAEQRSVDSADVRYTISTLQTVENAHIKLPIHILDMHDTVESFPPPHPEPPGEGAPDLWYVGRLDGAKGPDLFIELVSRMPRELYARCRFCGPDNTWSATDRWSDHLLNTARSKGVDATYEGVLSDEELRRIYKQRTVLVIPSRTDAFNYVALEAVLNACPVLLSDRTGALGFLRDQYPHLAPPAMSPDDLDAAASSLHAILSDYERVARRNRRTLLDKPFPAPREGFMDAVYAGPTICSPEAREAVGEAAIEFRNKRPLLTRPAADWRPRRTASAQPKVTVVIPTLDRPALLAPTLACLLRQTLDELEVIVVDDGSKDALGVRAAAQAFAPMVRYMRIGNAGEAGAVNRGIAAARGEYVNFLSDDDAYAPELLAEAVRVLDANADAIGTYPDWDIVDTCGYFVEAHRLPEYERRLMLCAHWCLPGPGVVIRRNVLQRIGGRDLSFKYVSDFDLWLRATAFGPMIHLPHKLAYWRLHGANLTTSDKRRQMADERIRLLQRLFLDPAEQDRSGPFRDTAFAAAHLAAAAILGQAESAEALRHLREAERLDPALLQNLPPNMAGYPAVWPAR